KGMAHYEWQERKKGQSWKTQMKSDMDACICEAQSYEDFVRRMKEKGYAAKGETFGDNALKYLSFSAPEQERFTRVSEKNFGEGYTKEAIKERIENRVKAQRSAVVRKSISFPVKPDSKRMLIDTGQEKFQENSALKHWADIENLKIAAASYAEGGSMEELEQTIAQKSSEAKAARSELVRLEHEMKAAAEILKYAKQYAANRKYQKGYEKAKDQDAYFRKYETQIILFGGAENMMKRYGIKTASLNVEKMQTEYDAMTAQKIQLRKTYKTAEKEVAEADKQLKNIRQYLGNEKEGQERIEPKRRYEMSL
ncbi:MAG: relaxase/mobilization nuclease domain-containing protein, partial [Ruminococcus flavefaciens]|nr:relaxase/mobilization nuclease domain-containing protein [Ruminococcus flavefaciens]